MLTEFDRKLLNYIQANLPVSKRPFAVVADKLETDEQTVLERMRHLKKEGYIRRIGAFFDSKSLGYTGTLVAVKVQCSYLETVAEKINSYPGITHNYERVGEYNLWFTLLTYSKTEQDSILEEISRLPGVDDLMNLPAIKKYKVNVEFKFKE